MAVIMNMTNCVMIVSPVAIANDQDYFPVSEVKDSVNARVPGKLVSFIDTKIELLKIEVEINRHKVTAVIDSGAGNSLMSDQSRHQLALELTPNDTVWKAIGEHDFNAIGTVNENMTIHGIQMASVDLTVFPAVPIINIPLLLGVDFLRANKIELCIKEDC